MIKNKFFVTLTIGLAIFATAIFGLVAFNSVEETPDISYNGEKVIFSGKYDTEVALDGADIELMSQPVVVKMRFNGQISDTSLQGDFIVESEESTCFAAIANRDTDYIKISQDGKVFMFNFETPVETIEFYENIR